MIEVEELNKIYCDSCQDYKQFLLRESGESKTTDYYHVQDVRLSMYCGQCQKPLAHFKMQAKTTISFSDAMMAVFGRINRLMNIFRM